MKLSVIHELYPFNKEWRNVLVKSILFGVSIFLFLFIFQPFGLSNYQAENKVFHLLGYGIVTSLVLFLNSLFFSLLFPKWYSESCWTVGKNILFVLINFFFIGSVSVHLKLNFLQIKDYRNR